MKNPAPINLMTPEESRSLGWQAEARDADGHLCSQHARFEDDAEMAGYVRAALAHGQTVTIWPKGEAAEPEEAPSKNRYDYISDAYLDAVTARHREIRHACIARARKTFASPVSATCVQAAEQGDGPSVLVYCRRCKRTVSVKGQNLCESTQPQPAQSPSGNP